MNILLASIIMGGLGFLFAAMLVYANKKFHVEVDPRISQIEQALPGVNCGGCGYPSCASYAEAIVKNNEKLTKCVVANEEAVTNIAQLMGKEVNLQERQIAFVFCQGDREASSFPGRYKGIKDCTAAIYSSDVAKRCKFGCVGLGSCVTSCPFNAIFMSEKSIPIVDAKKCTGCGNCVAACPRSLIELHFISQTVHVYCKSKDPGPIARSICKKACIACGICVKAAAADNNADALTLVDNLAVTNYTKYASKPSYAQKCPTKAITENSNVINL